MDLLKYIEDKLREDKKIKIEIDKEIVNGFMKMNWLIDNKFELKDIPFEVFEGEEIWLKNNMNLNLKIKNIKKSLKNI